MSGTHSSSSMLNVKPAGQEVGFIIVLQLPLTSLASPSGHGSGSSGGSGIRTQIPLTS